MRSLIGPLVAVAALSAAPSWSCGGSRNDGRPADQVPGAGEGEVSAEAADDDVQPGPAPIDASVAVSEAEARAFLSERFRRAGYRIRYDVRVRADDAFDITFDGYDPDRRTGYEYIDAVERDTDVVDAERAALAASSDYRVFVIDAVDADVLRASVEMFLSALTD